MSATAFVRLGHDGVEVRRSLAQQLVVDGESPESARAVMLVGSVIRQAVTDAYGRHWRAENDDRGGHFSRAEALMWLESTSEEPGSFRNLCELADCDPDAILAAIRRRYRRA